MKKLLAFAVIIAAAFLYGCGGTSSGKALVEINGSKITEGDLEFLGEMNPRLKAQIDSPAGKKRILDNLVEQELLYQEAVKEGVNRDSKVKAKIDLYRKVIIAQSLIDKKIEEAAKKYYDSNTDEFKKLKMAHIMVKYESPEDLKKAKKGAKEKVRGENEALDIANKLKARIDKGEGFEKVAAEASEDLSSKTRGGDLGLVSKGDKRMDGRGFGPLVEKAFEMKVGEVAGPIKTQKGYHIITVTRGIEPESFDEAKQEIMFKVRNDSRTELLANIKKESKVEYPGEEKKETAAKPGEAKPGEVKPGEPAAPSPEGAGVVTIDPNAQPKAEEAKAAVKPADAAKPAKVEKKAKVEAKADAKKAEPAKPVEEKKQ